jgi:ankyrin repeat protein
VEATRKQTTQRPKQRQGRKAERIVLLLIVLFALSWAGYRQYTFERLQRPLLQAVTERRASDVEALLRQGADPNLRMDLSGPFAFWRGDSSGAPSDPSTVLMFAAGGGQTDTVRVLLEHGADVNGKQSKRLPSTPLDQAAHTGTVALESMKLLIAKGADVNARNAYGATPLFNAIYQNNLIFPQDGPKREENGVSLLLDHGADVNARDNHGLTPLLFAAQGRCFRFVPLLIERGADVNARDDGGRTALIYTAMGLDTATTRILLDHGAKINTQALNGMTALQAAIENGPLRPEEALEDIGAEDQRLLIERLNYLDLIRLLLAKGADARLKDAEGESALQVAESQQDNEVVALLRGAVAPTRSTGR